MSAAAGETQARTTRIDTKACHPFATDRDIFTTELVIRMERADFRMCEIPLEIEELRPAPINIMKRVPGTLKNLWRLWKATRKIKRPEHVLDRISRPGEFVEDRSPTKGMGRQND